MRHRGKGAVMDEVRKRDGVLLKPYLSFWMTNLHFRQMLMSFQIGDHSKVMVFQNGIRATDHIESAFILQGCTFDGIYPVQDS